MKVLRKITTLLNGLVSVCFYTGIVCMLIVVVLLFLESIIRKTLGYSIAVSNEAAGIGMLLFVALGVGYMHQKGGHLRATFIVDRLPTQVSRILEFSLDILSLPLLFVFSYVWCDMTVRAYQLGSEFQMIEWPLWPFQAVALLGWVALIIAAVQRIVRGTRHIFGGPSEA